MRPLLLNILGYASISLLLAQFLGWMLFGRNTIHTNASWDATSFLNLEQLILAPEQNLSPIQQTVITAHSKTKGVSIQFLDKKDRQDFLAINNNLGRWIFFYDAQLIYPFVYKVKGHLSGAFFHNSLFEQYYIWIIYDWF